MRVSRQQAAASREKILDAAAKRFRERGLDGIGVADLMKDAGFTHGGFYAHFESKEDLMAPSPTTTFPSGTSPTPEPGAPSRCWARISRATGPVCAAR